MLEQSQKPKRQIANILTQLREKQLLIINPKRKNGLILYKPYHAEFAGPGAAIGAKFDEDVLDILPVGVLSLLIPTTSQERINGYKLRRQWVKLAQQISSHSTPQERAQTILNQFEHWFDAETTRQLPDEAFALLVGVLPQTINAVRHDIDWVS